MSRSIASSVAGKTKVKIVFLGGQAVGKSSIIEKYIHNRFD
jgi:GTPase SAR1 family protein